VLTDPAAGDPKFILNPFGVLKTLLHMPLGEKSAQIFKLKRMSILKPLISFYIKILPLAGQKWPEKT
jgi:hypothetical protein